MKTALKGTIATTFASAKNRVLTVKLKSGFAKIYENEPTVIVHVGLFTAQRTIAHMYVGNPGEKNFRPMIKSGKEVKVLIQMDKFKVIDAD